MNRYKFKLKKGIGLDGMRNQRNVNASKFISKFICVDRSLH